MQVRRDNPRLTTRREGGHTPVRIVMSRTLDLPEVSMHQPFVTELYCLTSLLVHHPWTCQVVSGVRSGGVAEQKDLAVQDANLWDVSSAPTIVMTQRGARKDFQELLRSKGVEVVQFDFLTPEAVAAYCHERGFLQVLQPASLSCCPCMHLDS